MHILSSDARQREGISRLPDRVEVPNVFVLVHESRSGSTFLANLLSRHPSISIAPESDLLRSIWRWSERRGMHEVTSRGQLEELLREIWIDEKFQSWHLDRNQLLGQLSASFPIPLSHVARSILVEYGRVNHPGSRVYGLKRGGWNACHLRSISQLMPGVSFLNIVRDGRAVFASEKRAIHRKTGRPFQEDPVVAGWRWRYYARSFRDAGESGYEVRYEDLISDPPSVISGILRFLGIDTSSGVIDEMLRPHSPTYVPEYVADLHKNVGKPPITKRIHAWKRELDKSEIRMFERVASDVLEEKGYQLVYPRGHWDTAYRTIVDIQQQINRRIRFHKWRKARRRKRT